MMNKYVMKAISFLVLFGLLTSTMQPVLASNGGLSKDNVKVAYVHEYSSEIEDELSYLSNLENKNYNYDEFNPEILEDLWIYLANYRVIILEISDEQENKDLISAFSIHKKQIENWIKGGGRLYVSIYGSHESTLNWLPDDLVVTSDKIGVTEYDILVNNDIVAASVQSVQNENAGFFTSSNGYTSLISAKTNDMVAPILISRTYGAGEITLSNGEFEKGFHPEVIEPLFVITLSAIVIFVVAQVATHLISKHITKPYLTPKIITFCRENKYERCDEEDEADDIVEFGTGIVVGAGVGAVKHVIGRAATSLGHTVAYQMHKAHMINAPWAKGLSSADYTNIIISGNVAIKNGLVKGFIRNLPESTANELLLKGGISLAESGAKYAMNKYAPQYPDSNSFTPADTELVTMFENAYDIYIDPVEGYTQYFDVNINTNRLRIYLSADISTCAYFVKISDSFGQNIIPTQKYFGTNTIEYEIDNPSAGRWRFVLNPDTELAGKNGAIIIQQDKFKGNILFDTSHNESFGADGSWSTFVEELRAVGFRVDILSQAPITLDKLDDYDVFVFGGWAHTQLTSNELNAIDEFVKDGGGLLLSFDEFTENVYNPLSNKYGVEFIQNVGLNDPTDDEESKDNAPVLHVASTHPIFDNVAFSQFYWVHYLKTVTSPSQAVLFSDGDTVDQNGNPAAYKPMIAVAEVGSGKVVSVADANLWNNWDWDQDGSPDLYDRDNLQLGVNIISWLSDVGSVEVVPNFNNLPNNMGEVSPMSEQKDRFSSGTSKPLNPIMTKNMLNAISDNNLLVEFEDIFVGTDGKVKEIKNKIAIYGIGNIDLMDKVSSEANLTFDREPNQTMEIGDIKQLSWNNIAINNYTRIGYTISNIIPEIPQHIQVSSKIIPDTISKDSESKVIIKYELNMLESVNDANLNLLIPKRTELADITINQKDALVFDTGTHYRVTYRFGTTYAGDHKTIYLPVTIHPKGKGVLNLIQSPQVSTTISGSTFIANATSIQISQSYRGTSLNYELEVLNLTIVDTSVSVPIITSPDESILFVLEQGKAQQGLIQIRNDGDVQTSVKIGLNSTTRLPAGSENIDTSWISLNSDTFQIKARETKNITFEVNVPLTAVYNKSYIGNIEISDDNNEKTIVPTLIQAIEKDLFKSLIVSSSSDQIYLLVNSNVTINVVDDDLNPINNSTIILTGAGVDVAPVFTGNDGNVAVPVYPRESGIIHILAKKPGYTSSETNIRVVSKNSTTPIDISFTNPTPANRAVLVQNYACINTTVSDASTAFIDWNRSLVGWWRFNSEKGENAAFFRDWSSWKNNAVCSGTNCPVSTSGKFGNALTFDGINDYIDAGNAPSLNITGNLTIEAWVKPERLETAHIVKKAARDSADGYELSLSKSTGKAYFRVNQNTSHNKYKLLSTSKYPLDGNTWIHLAGIYNGSHVQIYFNGNLEKSKPGPAAILSNIDNLTIGGPDRSRHFKGSIDEVRIWNRALSPEEIKASYDAGIYRLYSNFTNLTNGKYSYRAYAQNLEGKVKQTKKRTLTLIDQ